MTLPSEIDDWKMLIYGYVLFETTQGIFLLLILCCLSILINFEFTSFELTINRSLHHF